MRVKREAKPGGPKPASVQVLMPNSKSNPRESQKFARRQKPL
jgi:hypothetical protein